MSQRIKRVLAVVLLAAVFIVAALMLFRSPDAANEKIKRNTEGVAGAEKQTKRVEKKAERNQRQIKRNQRKIKTVELRTERIFRVVDREPGIPGIQGPIGKTGSPGALGPIGPEGVFGTPGATGPAGAPGKDGATGKNGVDGEPGPKGDTGDAGAQGPGPTDEQVAAAVAAYLTGRTWTCEPTADPLDPPGRQTCTLDP